MGGAVVDAMIGAGSVYYITGETRSTVYFGDQQIYNIGGGSLPALGGVLASGIYSTKASYSAPRLLDPHNDRPLEVRREAGGETLSSALGLDAISMDEKPFYRDFECNDYIRNLPGLSVPPPPEVIQMGQEEHARQLTIYTK